MQELDYILKIRLLEGILDQKTIGTEYLRYAHHKGWIDTTNGTLSEKGASTLIYNKKKIAKHTLDFFEAIDNNNWRNLKDDIYLLLEYFLEAKFINWTLLSAWSDCLAKNEGVEAMLDALSQQVLNVVHPNELEIVAGVKSDSHDFMPKLKEALKAYLLHGQAVDDIKKGILFCSLFELGLFKLEITEEGEEYREETRQFLRMTLERSLDLYLT